MFYIDGEPYPGLNDEGSGIYGGTIWAYGEDTGDSSGYNPADDVYYIDGQQTSLDSYGDGWMDGYLYQDGYNLGTSGWDRNYGMYFIDSEEYYGLDENGNGIAFNHITGDLAYYEQGVEVGGFTGYYEYFGEYYINGRAAWELDSEGNGVHKGVTYINGQPQT